MAIGAYFYTSYMMDPIYVASGTLYITGDVNAISGSIKQDTNLSDLMVSQELAKTYGQILSSNTFFKDVAEKSDSGYSYAAIQGMSTITNVEGTGMLKISVSHTNPQMAANLANTILNLAPDEIARVVVAGSATIIDPAEVPKAPASPSVPRGIRRWAQSSVLSLQQAMYFCVFFWIRPSKALRRLRQSFIFPCWA